MLAREKAFSFLCITALTQLGCLLPAIADPPTENSRSTIASASLVANAFNLDGSVRSESLRMLNEALESTAALGGLREIRMSSRPLRYLTDYSERDLCSEEFALTTAAPIQYQNRSFASIKELHRWVGDLSKGSGDDGEDLYSRCPGSCSPQFLFKIIPTPEQLYASAVVVCGPARDRADNRYELQYEVAPTGPD